MTGEERVQIEQSVRHTHGALTDFQRLSIVNHVLRLRETEEELLAADAACSAFQVRKAIDALLGNETIVLRGDPPSFQVSR